jgi:hypothetical protein
MEFSFKVKGKVALRLTMKTYGRTDVWIDAVLTSALVGGEWTAPRPGHFIPGEITSSTHWIGRWMGPRAGLDDMEK